MVQNTTDLRRYCNTEPLGGMLPSVTSIKLGFYIVPETGCGLGWETVRILNKPDIARGRLTNSQPFMATEVSLPWPQETRHWTYWATCIQSTSSYPVSVRSIFILSSHLCLGLAGCFFPSRFPTKVGQLATSDRQHAVRTGCMYSHCENVGECSDHCIQQLCFKRSTNIPFWVISNGTVIQTWILLYCSVVDIIP
jgi:hypothetical protein